MRHIKDKHNGLTAEELRRWVSYDPDTGEFRWLEDSGPVKQGDLAGYIDGGTGGYRRIGMRGGVYFASRLAWLYMTGAWPEHLIDHRNGDKTDDRWRNLRPATNAQNIFAIGMSNQWRGLERFMRRDGVRYIARIRENGRKRYLGCFRSFGEAQEARLAEEQRIYGQFARAA